MTWTALAVAVPARLDPGNGQAREWLERELADPVYRDTRDPVQRALDAVLRWVSDLLERLQGPTGSVPWWVGLLAGLVVLGLVLLGSRQVRRTRRLRSPASEGVLGAEQLTAAEFRARARAALTDGRYAACLLDAVRAIARGAVERTVLEDSPSLTAHEIAERLGLVFPDHAAALRRAADRFDAVAYGGAASTRAEALEVLDLDTALQGARPQQPSRQAPAGLVLS